MANLNRLSPEVWSKCCFVFFLNTEQYVTFLTGRLLAESLTSPHILVELTLLQANRERGKKGLVSNMLTCVASYW